MSLELSVTEKVNGKQDCVKMAQNWKVFWMGNSGVVSVAIVSTTREAISLSRCWDLLGGPLGSSQRALITTHRKRSIPLARQRRKWDISQAALCACVCACTCERERSKTGQTMHCVYTACVYLYISQTHS